MRIIAGSARSMPLKTLEGRDTRPTTDRIKETLFNILQTDIPGCYFLDLYAGSGQIGLEALSRGSAYAVFVENNKKAAACIMDNLRFTKLEGSARLLTMDALSALRSLDGTCSFDIIFMDPPYRQGLEADVLAYLSGSKLLNPGGQIIVEAEEGTDFSYLPEYGLQVLREKNYKTNKHVFIGMPEKISGGDF